ncbi:MAG: DNA-binding response regulator [Sphingomonas sp. 28-66-16]|nr:MAG: DNA-binding response regulator [Sphingomonas sp. 28-66-16]
MRLLIVEDDPRAARQLVADLAELGHDSEVAADGRAGIKLASAEKFDAILLDVMLPFVDGVGVAGLLRERGLDVPIIMLTALTALEERLSGLDAGADDYLVKPAAASEIDARLRAIIRRTARATGSGIIRVGDLEINELRHRVTRHDRVIVLQNMEFRLLAELARHAGNVVTRTMLYERVWKYDFEPATNVVESYIRRLRLQLNAAGERDLIKTIRGVGYMLTEAD